MQKLKNLYKKCADRIQSQTFLRLFLIYSFFFAIFFAVYFSVSTISSSDDHFFHFQFAQTILDNGFFHSFQDFKSIYFSKISFGNQHFAYYNFLFYLVILPFTAITPLYLGIKLYAVFIVAFAFTLLYHCLRKIDIRNPFIWTLLIIAITNTSSIWRFFLSRPYTLAPSLLLLLLVFLYRKNYIGVFTISFIYLYWHGATFFLPLCMVIGYYIIEAFYQAKPDNKNLLAGLAGTVAAVLLTYTVSSGFLLYMHDNILGPYMDTIFGKKVAIAEGGELYPIDFFNFIQGNALIFAAFVTIFSVDCFNYVAYKFKKISRSEYLVSMGLERRILQTTVLILTALFFLGTVVASGRFGDFFTFFAGLYIALSVDYIRRTIQVSGSAILKKGIVIGLSIVLIYLFTSNMLFLQERIARGTRAEEMYQVGMWLNRNTKPGDIIFNSNWSWFPELYYYSPKNNYITGLEPRFIYAYDPKLYWFSTHITLDGYVCDQQECKDLDIKKQIAIRQATSSQQWANTEGDKIAETILNTFKSKYIVSSKDYFIFNYVMEHNKHFKREIYDSVFGFYVYSIKNDKK